MLKYVWLALLIGFVLDVVIGDPRFLYHPVRIIGNGISLVEKGLRRVIPDTKKGLLFGGFVLTIIICFFSGLVPWLILTLCFKWNVYLGIAVMSFMCYQMLALKSLKQESMKVYYALKDKTLQDGQRAVSMIVGRDTEGLDERGVIKATVETVAENFSDGIFAPLFYMIIGGPVLMFIYKGINTMDSMVGYKNDRYIYFGRFAAKLDDLANYVPSRLAALFLVIAAGLGGFNMKNSFRVFKRDRYNHASPNSAQTESAVAGALDIELAGNAYYFGKLYEKPTMGDANREICLEDIRRANKLSYIAAFLAVVVMSAIYLGVWQLI